jgi:hypothetical protein
MNWGFALISGTFLSVIRIWEPYSWFVIERDFMLCFGEIKKRDVSAFIKQEDTTDVILKPYSTYLT